MFGAKVLNYGVYEPSELTSQVHSSLGCLQVACKDFNFVGFHSLHIMEVASLTSSRRSDVSQVMPQL